MAGMRVKAKAARRISGGEPVTLLDPHFRAGVGGIELSPNAQEYTISGPSILPDGSLYFGTAGDYISTPDMISAALLAGKSLTVHAWVNPTSWGGGDTGRLLDNGSLLIHVGVDGSARSNAGSGSLPGSISLNTDQLVSVSLRMDPDGHCYVTFFVNCIQSGLEQDAGIPAAAATALFLGNREAGDRTFDGTLQVGAELGEFELSRTIKWGDNHCPSGVKPSWQPGGWYTP